MSEYVKDWKRHNIAVKMAARTIRGTTQTIDEDVARLQEHADQFRAMFAVYEKNNAELVENSQEFGIFDMLELFSEDLLKTCRRAKKAAKEAMLVGTDKEIKHTDFRMEGSEFSDSYEKAYYFAEHKEIK